MINTVSIIDVLSNSKLENTKITVKGWIRTARHSKTNISFLDLYDGSCITPIQIIAHKNLYNYKNEILKITSGCSIIVIGIIIKSIGKKQNVEIFAKNIQILGWIDNPNTYPISAKKHTMEHLRNFSHLRPRTKIIGAISRIRHTLSYSIHNFLHKRKFIWIPTPIITALDTEGNGKMFSISNNNTNNHININPLYKKNQKQFFFGKKAFLTVSGQLNAETYACALSKVYTFGPTFRAEQSNTHRHLAEFWMIEPEIAFATLDDIIILAESLLKNIIQKLLIKQPNDLQYLSKTTKKNIISQLENFINIKFNYIEYTDAIKLLQTCNNNFKQPIHWGMDLLSEHERYLSEQYFKSTTIIKNYPKEIKAFYMRLNDDNKTVASMDILVPYIGEIIGGSQREERLIILDQRLKENNLTQENYWWYRDLRRYGTVPHSGFGLGFERLIAYITGMNNIRDVVPFPRTPNNIHC